MFLVIFVILHQKNSIDLTYTNKHYFFTKKRIFLILVYKSQKSNIGYNLIPISNLNITLSLWPKTQYLHESLVLLDFSFDLCIINSNHCATLKFLPLSLLPIPDHLSLSTYVYLPLYNRRRPRSRFRSWFDETFFVELVTQFPLVGIICSTFSRLF